MPRKTSTVHGTVRGYKLHMRYRHQWPCWKCRKAHERELEALEAARPRRWEKSPTKSRKSAPATRAPTRPTWAGRVEPRSAGQRRDEPGPCRMTAALDVRTRTRRSLRSGLVRVPVLNDDLDELDEPRRPAPIRAEPTLEARGIDTVLIGLLYRQTQAAIDAYHAQPFTSRVAPCPGPCGGMVRTRTGRNERTGRLVTWCDPCKAAVGGRPSRTTPRRPYIEPPAPATAEPAACGTNNGYHRHRRLDEPACDDCKAAHADAARDQPAYRQARRQGGRIAA